MRLSCLQETLSKGLGIVGRSVATRSTLPVLSNVLLASDQERLKLSATNLEVSTNCWIGAKVDQEGSITIPAKLLTEFINSLPAERIDLVLDEASQTLHITCANYAANIKGISAKEFPIVPGLNDGDNIIQIEPDNLKQAINQVTFAAATEESRPVLTGIQTKFSHDTLTMTGTDGFRLSVKTMPLTNSIDHVFEVIVPAKALSEVARVIGDQEEPIQIVITEEKNQILFHLTDVDVISQLIEGTFPDVSPIIPKEHLTRTIVDTTNFLKAAKVAHLFARDSANIAKLNIKPSSDAQTGHMILESNTQDLGDNVGELEVYVEGDPIEIAFNTRYLIDVLSILDNAQVVIETTATTSPGLLKPVGDDTFTHVIMPMHLNR